MLLALVMGSMADIVDRRRFAIASQSWMLASVAALAALTLTDVITPGLALGLTFALGAGMATTFVIYQALTQDFVPRSELLGGRGAQRRGDQPRARDRPGAGGPRSSPR